MTKTISGTNFNFPGQTGIYKGKVRDVYDLGESLMFVATDRYSAFDKNLAIIPRKGELVTQISKWWFEQTKGIVKNHIISYPDPNVTHGIKCKVVPIEMVVRGYMTGVTATSLWHNYSKGQRNFGNFTLPDDLAKNHKLPEPVITPTTKFEEHDRNLTPQQAVDDGLVSADIWQSLQDIALRLFACGQKKASEKGLILVDTKYEFGLDQQDNIILIDEIHTPDSSRYWVSDRYLNSLANNQEPDNFDKEYLRLWYKDRCDPYNDKELPTPSSDVIKEMTNRYIYIYEQLTGNNYTEPDSSVDLCQRIETNILKEIESNK